jgi:hypothetical protein
MGREVLAGYNASGGRDPNGYLDYDHHVSESNPWTQLCLPRYEPGAKTYVVVSASRIISGASGVRGTFITHVLF